MTRIVVCCQIPVEKLDLIFGRTNQTSASVNGFTSYDFCVLT